MKIKQDMFIFSSSWSHAYRCVYLAPPEWGEKLWCAPQ